MREKTKGGAFFRDSAALLANNLFMFAAAIVSGVMIARGLGPEGKGIYAIALLFPSLLASLGGMGLNTAAVFFLNREPAARGTVTGSVLAYSALSGAALSLLIVIFSRRIDAYFLNGAGVLFVLAAAPIPFFYMLYETVYSLFLAGRDIRSISSANAAKSFSHLAIVFALLLAGCLTAFWAILSQAVAAAAALLMGAAALKAKGYFSGLSIERAAFGKLFSFGLRQHMGTAAQVLNYRADMFISAALLSPYQVGLYSVSLSMSELLWHLPNAAGQVLYPKTAASAEDSHFFTADVARHVFYLTLLPAAAVWLTAEPLTGLLFGKEFVPAAAPIKLLLPGAVLLGVSKVLGSHLSASGAPQHNSAASVLSLLSSVTLCLLLIPRWGLSGAAAATAASYAINLTVMAYYFRKTSRCGLGKIFLPQKGDLTFYISSLRGLLRRSYGSRR